MEDEEYECCHDCQSDDKRLESTTATYCCDKGSYNYICNNCGCEFSIIKSMRE